ncbi:MAG: hypothetical protein J5I99_09035 [Verrucomicrobia bacterium]|nr:hypothetical protein [Verrucomicrobiota bacterium]
MPSANAPKLDVGPLAEAVKRISAKTPLGTALRSDEIAKLPLALRERAQISARVESLRILSQIQRSLEQDLGQVSDNGMVMSKGRFVAKLLDVAKEVMGDAPRKGGVQDIRSVGRAKLIHDMQTRQAYGKAAWAIDTDPENLNAAPAQEFVRIEARRKPREDWPQRWRDAGGEMFGGRMIALKTDPVWARLSRFQTPWPPYDYNSGMGVVDIYRDEAEALGLVQRGERLAATQQDDFNASLEYDVSSITPELREMLQTVGLEVSGDTARLKTKKVEPEGKSEPSSTPATESEKKSEPEKKSEKPKTIVQQLIRKQSKGFDLNTEIERTPASVQKLANISTELKATRGGANYKPSVDIIFMQKNKESWSGHPSTFHHEFGHNIHHKTGVIPIDRGVPMNADLAKAMAADFAAWKEAAKATHGENWADVFSGANYRASAHAHMKSVGYAAQDAYSKENITAHRRAIMFWDTIGGLSLGEQGIGHSRAYYRRDGGKWGGMEVYANMYAAIVMDWPEFAASFPLTDAWIRTNLEI